jgi:hypothetical protein
MRKKRYEMLLPLRYNDGRPVEDEKIYQTHEELISRFDAVSVQPGFVHGTWVHEGIRYEDEFRRIVVDVDDLPEHEAFFVSFKSILRERFQQIEVYIVSHPVDIL